jgi:hypothetical protein
MTENTRLRIEMASWPTADLVEFAANAKVHTLDSVASIAKSIVRFGFRDPIGITAEGVIVEGHGRAAAARSLGMSSVPVIILHGMTDRERDLYRIAHNKIAQMTGFDFERLVGVLQEVVADTNASVSVTDLGMTELAFTDLVRMFNDEDTTKGTRRPEASFKYEAVVGSREDLKKLRGFLSALLPDGAVLPDGSALMELATRAMAGTALPRAEHITAVQAPVEDSVYE